MHNCRAKIISPIVASAPCLRQSARKGAVPARVSGASTGAGEETTRFAKASRGDMAAAFMQQLSARSALRMPQCSVLQGCSRLQCFARLKDGRLMLSTAAWFTAVTAMQLALCAHLAQSTRAPAVQLCQRIEHTRKSQTDARACCRAGIREATCSARERVCVGRVTDASLFARRAVKDACHVLLWAAHGPNLRAVSCSIATAPEHDTSEDDA